MRLSNNWFKAIKTAGGTHGDTLHGQMKAQEAAELEQSIQTLKRKAASNELGVLPRWAGEVKRKILMLPPAAKVNSLSMFEMTELKNRVSSIKETMEIYSARRMMEISSAHSS